MIIDIEHLYKAETGNFPCAEEELEFMVWRSKGQWVINISDAEKMELSGRESIIRFTRTNPDYLEWLENKVIELLTQNKSV
jgi:hypothetical protein